jgi:hypothetical protein
MLTARDGGSKPHEPYTRQIVKARNGRNSVLEDPLDLCAYRFGEFWLGSHDGIDDARKRAVYLPAV